MRRRIGLALSGVSSRWVRALIGGGVWGLAFALSTCFALVVHDPALCGLVASAVGLPSAFFAVLYVGGWTFSNSNLEWWWWHDAH